MSSSSLRNVHVSLRNVHVWPGSLVHLTWVLGTRSFCEGFAATEAPKRFCVGSYASRAANRGPLEWSEWPWGPRIPSRMSGNLREKTLQKGCVWSRAKIFERAAKQGHEDDGFQDCHPHEFKSQVSWRMRIFLAFWAGSKAGTRRWWLSRFSSTWVEFPIFMATIFLSGQQSRDTNDGIHDCHPHELNSQVSWESITRFQGYSMGIGHPVP